MQITENGSVLFNWYRKTVSKKEWVLKYEKWDKYPVLNQDKEQVEFAYMSVEPTLDLVCSKDDLVKVREWYKTRNIHPRPN